MRDIRQLIQKRRTIWAKCEMIYALQIAIIGTKKPKGIWPKDCNTTRGENQKQGQWQPSANFKI